MIRRLYIRIYNRRIHFMLFFVVPLEELSQFCNNVIDFFSDLLSISKLQVLIFIFYCTPRPTLSFILPHRSVHKLQLSVQPILTLINCILQKGVALRALLITFLWILPFTLVTVVSVWLSHPSLGRNHFLCLADASNARKW